MKLSLSCGIRLALLIGLLVCSSISAAEPTRTVILVRHAERSAGMDQDVGISEAGQCRAKALATMLSDAAIKGIYTSEAKRTQQTAEPLAQKLRIKPEVIPAKDVDGLLSRLRSGSADGSVLVVGHSNTVPTIIERLSGQTVPAISDTEFDRLFIVTMAGQQSKVITLRYPGCAQ